MKFFNLSFEAAILRFYLMMILAIAPFYLGVPYMALLSAPVFLSIMLGVSFKSVEEYNQKSLSISRSTLAKNSSTAA